MDHLLRSVLPVVIGTFTLISVRSAPVTTAPPRHLEPFCVDPREDVVLLIDTEAEARLRDTVLCRSEP
jgi:hypothetical protein